MNKLTTLLLSGLLVFTPVLPADDSSHAPKESITPTTAVLTGLTTGFFTGALSGAVTVLNNDFFLNALCIWPIALTAREELIKLKVKDQSKESSAYKTACAIGHLTSWVTYLGIVTYCAQYGFKRATLLS